MNINSVGVIWRKPKCFKHPIAQSWIGVTKYGQSRKFSNWEDAVFFAVTGRIKTLGMNRNVAN